MYRIERGNVNLYLVTFQLVNFTSGEVVWLRDYESKQWSE
jgi:PBP1b-binding outer membrane lipoprotein LpoB